MKTCKTCGETKEESLFNTGRNKCKECHKKYCKDRRENNEELRLKENEDMIWRRRLRDYGVSKDLFWKIFEKQGGKCAICLIDIDYKCHVDHNHTTNKARGLLCNNCNIALGQFNDNIKFLKNAIRYLNLNL